MPVAPEAIIERRAVDDARADGWIVFKLWFMGARGAPDRIFGKGGKAVVIEFKRPGKVATPQQERRHKQLRQAFGLTVYTVTTVEHVHRILGIGK